MRKMMLCLLVLGAALLSRRAFAKDAFYTDFWSWYYGEDENNCYDDGYYYTCDYVYQNDEFHDTTPTMPNRPNTSYAGYVARLVPYAPDWLCFLHPEIASQIVWTDTSGTTTDFCHWTGQQQTDFFNAFTADWNWYERGYQGSDFFPVGVNQATDGSTTFTPTDAWHYYVDSVALTIASEMGHWFGWTLRFGDQTKYAGTGLAIPSAQLPLLLDSRQMFSELDFHGNYLVQATMDFSGRTVTINGALTPSSPIAALDWLRRNNLIKDTMDQTIYAALDWGRDNLFHFDGGYTTQNETLYWQTAGYPPLMSVLNGTTTTDPENAGLGVRHWTAGCHGTSGLYKALLHTANIPVQILNTGCPNTFGQVVASHSQLYFPVINKVIDHSDDIYDARFRDQSPTQNYSIQPTTPSHSTSELMTSYAVYQSYYMQPSVTVAQACANVNVSIEVANYAAYALAPTNALMGQYCDDLASGASHANGLVHTSFNIAGSTSPFTVQFLENVPGRGSLWDRMAAKLAATSGGCTKFPR